MAATANQFPCPHSALHYHLEISNVVDLESSVAGPSTVSHSSYDTFLTYPYNPFVLRTGPPAFDQAQIDKILSDCLYSIRRFNATLPYYTATSSKSPPRCYNNTRESLLLCILY